jgi:hypothetical protein
VNKKKPISRIGKSEGERQTGAGYFDSTEADQATTLVFIRDPE